jgi:copper chaperone NosL
MNRLALASLSSVAAMAACSNPSSDGPAKITWDRDVCDMCSMALSDRHFAAQIRGGPKNRTHKFDDIGCALKWLERQEWSAEAPLRIWVTAMDDGRWLDAKTAYYVGGKMSPMGYGFAAHASPVEGAMSFDEMRRQILAPRPPPERAPHAAPAPEPSGPGGHPDGDS